MPIRRLVALAAAVALVVLPACSTGRPSDATTTTTTTLPTDTGRDAPDSSAVTDGGSSASSDAAAAAAPAVAPVLSPLPDAGPPLTVPDGSGHRAPPGVWPDACSLLSATQLRAIVHGAAAVTAQGSRGRNYAGTLTPRATSCTYLLHWGPKTAASGPASVSVTLRAVASPGPVSDAWQDRKQAAEQRATADAGLYADYGTDLGGASCFFDGTQLECVAGRYSFWVGGVDTRTAPASPAKRSDRWRNRVLAKVVVLLTERMVPQVDLASDPATGAVAS